MKSVILIGGPFDGKSTKVTDDLPAYWRIIYQEKDCPLVSDLPDIEEWSYSYDVLTYRRQLLAFPVPTEVIIYIYAGVDK